jgi:hypothetical protein
MDSHLGSYEEATAAQWNYRAKLCDRSTLIRDLWPPLRRSGRIFIFPPSTPPNTIIQQGHLDLHEDHVCGARCQPFSPPPPYSISPPSYGVHCPTCSC